MPKPKTAAATLVELGVTLAGAEAQPATPASCKRCRSAHDPQKSTSRYPSIFCSKACEGQFIRAELSSLTLDDCIRLQAKLEKLLRRVQEPLPFEKKAL
jgi:hypothetical protein